MFNVTWAPGFECAGVAALSHCYGQQSSVTAAVSVIVIPQLCTHCFDVKIFADFLFINRNTKKHGVNRDPNTNTHRSRFCCFALCNCEQRVSLPLLHRLGTQVLRCIEIDSKRRSKGNQAKIQREKKKVFGRPWAEKREQRQATQLSSPGWWVQ